MANQTTTLSRFNSKSPATFHCEMPSHTPTNSSQIPHTTLPQQTQRSLHISRLPLQGPTTHNCQSSQKSRTCQHTTSNQLTTRSTLNCPPFPLTTKTHSQIPFCQHRVQYPPQSTIRQAPKGLSFLWKLHPQKGDSTSNSQCLADRGSPHLVRAVPTIKSLLAPTWTLNFTLKYPCCCSASGFTSDVTTFVRDCHSETPVWLTQGTVCWSANA